VTVQLSGDFDTPPCWNPFQESLAGYVCGKAGHNVTSAEFRRLGKPPVTLAVLRVPNAILWGATPPAAFGGALVVTPQTSTAATDAA
jgi:hypothetical protein